MFERSGKIELRRNSPRDVGAECRSERLQSRQIERNYRRQLVRCPDQPCVAGEAGGCAGNGEPVDRQDICVVAFDCPRDGRRAAQQRVGGRDPGPQFFCRAGHRCRKASGTFTLGGGFDLDRTGQRMAGEPGKRAKIGDRQTGAPLDRPRLRHPPRACKASAGALSGKSRQIDGASIASSSGGKRPIDVAAELGRHPDPFRRKQPLDPARGCQFDARFGIVESAHRAGSDVGLDVVRSGGGEAGSVARQIQLERWPALGAGHRRRDNGRAAERLAEQARKRGEVRDIGVQIRRNSLFPATNREMARHGARRDLDGERIDDDTSAEFRSRRQHSAITDQGRDARREQRGKPRRSGYPEDRFVRRGEHQIRRQMGGPTGRGIQAAVPIRKRSAAVQRKRQW